MSLTTHYTRVAQLKTPEQFSAHLQALGADLSFDAELQHGAASPLPQKFLLGERVIGNRFCVQPMEGWDGEPNGMPSELTRRRWQHFGSSGAKLIWGGEVVAVRQDVRANPNQLMFTADTMRGIAELRACLLDAHRENFGSADDLCSGLQLTHSGRFSKPNDKKKVEPFILYEHPFLNSRYGLPPDVLEGKSLRTKFICRTFSDCTTGPRNGLVSGCCPLDPFYKNHPEHKLLKQAKK